MRQTKNVREIGFGGRYRRTLVLALTVGTLMLAGCEEEGALEVVAESVETERQSLNAHGEGTMWPAGVIPVCWESRRYSTERNWVRNAIRDTWEATGVIFTGGWKRCPSGWFDGVRIAWKDETPSSAFGLGVRGDEDGMVLNRVFDNYRAEDCQSSEANRRKCIEATAVHEFGHALGYIHEQARNDTPDWCNRGRENQTGRIYPTDEWDADSVMNYCNPEWREDFPPEVDELLSTHDINGTRHFYPLRQGDGILPIEKIAVNASNNGRLSLFAKMGGRLYHKQQEAAGRTSSKWPETSRDPWTSWNVIGAPSDNSVGKYFATARHTDNRIYVFVTDIYGDLHYAKQTAVDSADFYWSKPRPTTVTLERNSPLAASNYPDGGVAVFGKGTDGKLIVAKRSNYSWTVETLGDMEIGPKLDVGRKANGQLVAFTIVNGYFYSLSQHADGSWDSNWRVDWGLLPSVNTYSDMVSAINSRGNLQVFFGMTSSMEGQVWSVEYADDSLYVDQPVPPRDVCVAGICSSATAEVDTLGVGKRSDGRLVLTYYQDEGINPDNRRTLYVEEQADGSWSEPDFFPSYGQSAFRGEHPKPHIVCTNYTTSYDKLGCFSFINRDSDPHGEYYVTAVYEKSSMPGGYTPWFFLGFDYSDSGY